MSGYGKGEYLPLEKVEEQFARCRADRSMRSVSAVVRIGREQIAARGSMGSYRRVAALFGVLAVIAAVASFVLPDPFREQARVAVLVCLVAVLILGVGIAATWRDTQRLEGEDKRLRQQIFAILEDLLSDPIVKVKPPDWTEANFLRRNGAKRTAKVVQDWLETTEP